MDPDVDKKGTTPTPNGPVPSASEVLCPHCGQIHPGGWSHCPNTGKALSVGPALVGRVIAGRYRIIGLIGEGGMGAVYEAEHLAIGRRVALKRLHPELAVDAHAVHRFQREARAAGATGHENVVDILDLGFAEDGAPYLVMELLEGESLAERLQRETKLTARRAASIAGQVLAALEAVHVRGVIHRDLKPDNIFLTRRSGRRDFVKVLDFGVSKVTTTPEATKLTRTGMMVGTPHYMSPEQARGMRDLDHRVDLYAVGVILYECLTGQLPFQGSNYHALLQAILAGEPPRVQVLVPTLPSALAGIIHRALAKDRTDRCANARAMRLTLVPFGAAPPAAKPAQSEVPPAMTEMPTASMPSSKQSAHIEASRRTDHPTEPFDDVPPIRESSPLYVPVPLADQPRAFAISSADWKDSPGSMREPSMRPPAAKLRTGNSGKRSELPAAAKPPRISTAEAYAGEAGIKGAFVLAARRDLGIRRGARADEPLHVLDAIHRSSLDEMILPVSLLPASAVIAWLEAVERTFGDGSGAELHTMGRAVGGQLLPTRHRLFLRNATPPDAVSRIPMLWSSYVEGGAVRVAGDRIEVTSGPNNLPFLSTMAGFMERLLELSGARGAKCQPLTTSESKSLSLTWN